MAFKVVDGPEVGTTQKSSLGVLAPPHKITLGAHETTNCRPPTGLAQLDSPGLMLRNVCLWQVPTALVIAGRYDSDVWTPGVPEARNIPAHGNVQWFCSDAESPPGLRQYLRF